MKSSRLIPLIASFIGVACCLTSCTQSSESSIGRAALKPPKLEDPMILTDPEVKRMGLTTSPAEVRDLPEYMEVAGTVQADTDMTMPVLSIVPGRIEDVFVSIGDAVKKGKKIASIRSDEVAQIETELLEKILDIDAEEEHLRVKRNLAAKTFSRKQLLFENRIAAKAEVEAAEADLEDAEAAIKCFEAKRTAAVAATTQRLKLFGLQDQEIDAVLKTKTVDHRFDIYAPRDGLITARNVDPGEAVDQDKTLFTISDLRRVWVVAQVYEKDIHLVRMGMPAEAIVQGIPDAKFNGKINLIGSEVNSDNRTLPVRATVANPALKLKPQMFAKLILKTGTDHALVVHSGAIQKLGESTIVYVQIAPDTYQERKVDTGPTSGDYVTIKNGISAGDKVVIDGSVRLLGKIVQRMSQ